MKVSTIWLSLNASSGVIVPCAAALTILPIAAAMSEALRIGGTASWIGRSRRGAMMRSRQIRSAPSLPPRASSTAFRLSASASLSKSASAAALLYCAHREGAPPDCQTVPSRTAAPAPSLAVSAANLQPYPSPLWQKRPFTGRHLATEYDGNLAIL
jgi:hypothetical protein